MDTSFTSTVELLFLIWYIIINSTEHLTLSQLQPLSEFIMYQVSQLKIATLASILTVVDLLDGDQRGPTLSLL